MSTTPGSMARTACSAAVARTINPADAGRRAAARAIRLFASTTSGSGSPGRGEPDRGEPDRGEPDRGEPDRGERGEGSFVAESGSGPEAARHGTLPSAETGWSALPGK